MTMFVIHQCDNENCCFRFPLATRDTINNCPRCGNLAPPATKPFSPPGKGPASSPNGPPVAVLLDNIRSVYNVGSIFRTCDGAGVEEIHLCGMTATPDGKKLAKTALGATQNIPWNYHPNALAKAQTLAAGGMELWALESTPAATPLAEIPLQGRKQPLTLVVGNETAGIDPEILTLCQRTVCLPMLGEKDSLNASIAFGIALYNIRWPGN